MEHRSLGDQELEVLRYVADHAPATARQISDGFGGASGLARTTVLTVVERLRKKGYLTRRKSQGVYHYSPRVSEGEVLQGVVRQFVERTLAGSVSPVVAYLVQDRDLSDEDIRQLEHLVEELKAERHGGAE